MKLFRSHSLIALAALLTLTKALPVEPASTNKCACCLKANLPAAAFTDSSIYQVESTWTDDNGKETRLAAFKGQVQVIAMFFSSCEYACPALVHDIRKIEAALPQSLWGKVRFTLVSFDTDRDTPAVLHAYRERVSLPAQNWTLLRGKADDVLELSALLGVKFKKDARGQFAHSNIITVLNPEGEIIHQQIGLNQDVTASVAAVEKAAR